MKVNSLDDLKKIKSRHQEDMLLREIGHMHDNELLNIVITGNETEYYSDISKQIKSLKDYIDKYVDENVKLIYKDDPSQNSKFKIEISYNYTMEQETDSIKADIIKEFISKIYLLKNGSKEEIPQLEDLGEVKEVEDAEKIEDVKIVEESETETITGKIEEDKSIEEESSKPRRGRPPKKVEE